MITAIELALKLFCKKVVFCDASVQEDGNATIAVWSPFDMSFTVKDIGSYGARSRQAVTSAEITAIQLASELYPGFVIYSDSQDAIRMSNVAAIWVSRNLNKFADTLTKHEAGSGYICLNNPQPSRNWMQLKYDGERQHE